MITIDTKSLHARWFHFWALCWAQFTDGHAPGAGGKTSLCVYFWTCVGAPVFIGGCHVVVAWLLFYVTIYYPTSEWSLLAYAVQLAGLGVAGLAIWGAISIIRTPKKSGHQGVFALTGEYIGAAKRRVCPIIHIGEQQ